MVVVPLHHGQLFPTIKDKGVQCDNDLIYVIRQLYLNKAGGE